MTIKQESKFKMSLSTDEFLIKNERLTKDLPEFGTTVTEFRGTLSKIKLIDGQQQNVRTGVAKDKRDVKNALIALAAENSAKVFAFAKGSNNKTLMDEVHFSISDLGRMTDVALRTYSDELNKKMVPLLESLGKYGITAETQKIFADTLTAFENSLVKPRLLKCNDFIEWFGRMDKFNCWKYLKTGYLIGFSRRKLTTHFRCYQFVFDFSSRPCPS